MEGTNSDNDASRLLCIGMTCSNDLSGCDSRHDKPQIRQQYQTQTYMELVGCCLSCSEQVDSCVCLSMRSKSSISAGCWRTQNMKPGKFNILLAGSIFYENTASHQQNVKYFGSDMKANPKNLTFCWWEAKFSENVLLTSRMLKMVTMLKVMFEKWCFPPAKC